MVLLETRRLPIARIRLEHNLIVLGAVALGQNLPRSLGQLHPAALALALPLAIDTSLLLLPEGANLCSQRLELARVLLDRLIKVGELLGVGRRDEFE